MKKIGIITVVRTNNYGAELQAFALQKKLSNLGYKSEIIDYLYFKHRNYKPSKGSEPIINFGLKRRIKEYLIYRVISPVLEIVFPVFNSAVRNRIENFEKFHALNTAFSQTYRSYKELYAADLDYDIYMVGSDQVWNPGTGTSLEPYFLTFAPGGKRKISYASSFGVSRISDKYKNRYKDLINNIDYISLRERQGVAIIKELTNRRAIQTLDPTLLMSKEEWKGIIKSKSSFGVGGVKYILIYQLHDSDTIVELAYKLHRQLNLPILRLCKRAFFNRKDKNIKNIVDAGPLEYLSLFENASFVLTNSFHGTAFSVNFNIPFYSIISEKKENNSRIENFLEMLNAKERIIWEGTDVEPLKMGHSFEFTKALEILADKKELSINFLKESIEN